MTFDEWWEETGQADTEHFLLHCGNPTLAVKMAAKESWSAALDALSDLPEGWRVKASGSEDYLEGVDDCADELKQRIAEMRKRK